MTKLDLSDNLLDLTHTDTFKHLNVFSQLITLNLSCNYLPLLVKDHIFNLPSLQVLDLSRCELAAVEKSTLIKLPSLQMLFLGNNQLQSPLYTTDENMRKTENMDHDDHNNGMNYLFSLLHCNLYVLKAKRVMKTYCNFIVTFCLNDAGYSKNGVFLRKLLEITLNTSPNPTVQNLINGKDGNTHIFIYKLV